ncbi:hypothetical protein ILUMI_16286 [Ignelater luminosus]|uniref:Mutator-like transposase domain-containing protein n=1 Tax=Ignelater luminosus TaxID=2038154 RepID=A0A8K0G643_IGNLU|nr:hypothetical protein ILUMI_16286 [Ignelater luminosus]
MDYFLKKALSLQSLLNLKCTGSKLEYSSEKRSGLVSVYTLKCNMSDCEEHLATEKPQTLEEKSNNHSTINTAAVWDTLVMNVPPLGGTVQKIECVNHCIKNYSKHLYRIKKDMKSVALETRKLLTNQRIKDLTRNAQKAIYANAHGDISQLKHDLQNSVPCSFGNYSKCQTYLCNHVGDTASDNMSQLVSSGGHHHIFGSLNLIVIKSSQLIDNETNNRAELFMSLSARFNMGK